MRSVKCGARSVTCKVRSEDLIDKIDKEINNGKHISHKKR